MRTPSLETVVANGSDHPVPKVALPDHHDRRRPLVLCLWDAPNMDASLFSVTGADHHTVVRPQYDAFSRWLVAQDTPAAHGADSGGAKATADVEALLFLSVVSTRATQVAPFVTAARQSGFTVFCRDRDEGDIDDALVAVADQRLHEREAPGTLIVCSADQDLARVAAEPAHAAGWRVVVVAYRELCGWTDEAGFEFLDPEDIPNLFPKPLDRFDLSHLPTGGVFAPSLRQLTPVGGRG
ncbi:MAG: hypothetical protein KDB24_05905 [Microthrixaceae bacterium]|nr:hypothetical protein [Microthrixaceae bacterium]